MVSVLDFRSSGLGFKTGWGTALCARVRHFTLTVPLFAQMNLLLGVTLQWTSIPSRGE